MIDDTLAAILVCTECHAALNQEPPWLVCSACGLGFEVTDGIPNMLLSDARRR